MMPILLRRSLINYLVRGLVGTRLSKINSERIFMLALKICWMRCLSWGMILMTRVGGITRRRRAEIIMWVLRYKFLGVKENNSHTFAAVTGFRIMDFPIADFTNYPDCEISL